jgi:SAM-dependent methyltransferase
MPRLALGDALVLSPPGLAPITTLEARRLDLEVVELTRDRRADVLGLVRPGDSVSELRTADDVLWVVGTMPVRSTAAATAASLDRSNVLEAITRLDLGRTSRRRRVALRVVVRVTDERHYHRTALRTEIERRLGRLHDQHETADELWVLQTDPRTLRVAIRVPEWRRRSSRTSELAGSLRPSIAAAMVFCADDPRTVLDPCCGSGAILTQVAAAGGSAVGGDVSVAALQAAAANTTAPLLHLDARRLPFRDDSFDAVIANLPFGHRYQVQGTPVAWYRRTLSEALRVANAAVVLMPPTQPFRQALGRTRVQLIGRHDITVLGRAATIWSLRRP